MNAIDADAHVDENQATWDCMDDAERAFKPVGFDIGEGQALTGSNARQNRIWLIHGNARLHRIRDDQLTNTTQATRELLDIDERLRHMDTLGIDVQVLYPTTLLHAVTNRPDVELALCRAYNRWIAGRTESSGGRLRWAAQMPTMSIDDAIAELEFAKAHGACGAMKRGVEFDGHEAGDPYYYPLYAAAERLGLPICFHQGTSDPTLSNAIETARLAEFNVLAAFSSLAEHAVPDRFPELRFGFIEAGASWIPYLLKCLGTRGKAENAPYNFKMGFLAHNRFYVTCDTEDDVRTLLEFGAEDYLMIGTDYSHADQSSEIKAHQVITERGQRGELSPAVAGKIVSGNARRFYGL